MLQKSHLNLKIHRLYIMKKIVTLALCLGTLVSAGAQKTAVDAAKKLAGKTDQLTEARNLINGAMQDASTANDPQTYFIAGKIEFDAFNKANTLKQTKSDYQANEDEMGDQLLNGYKFFLKALELDQLPNEKGQVKPKVTSNINSTLESRVGDYWNSGAYFYNNKNYPKAYEAFYDCGDIASKVKTNMNDSTVAMAFKNAGLMAYSANELDKAADAFKRARLTNAADAETFTYEIASWQAATQKDTSIADTAKQAIREVAEQGVKVFGTQPLFFLNNIVSYMVDNNQYPEAIACVKEYIEKDPENGNLYGLLAFVDERSGNSAEAEANYRKVIANENADFDNLKNAAIFLYKEGTEKLNKVEGNSADARAAKAEILANYFTPASQSAEKARKLNPNDSRLASIIENIDYAITTYF